MLRWHLIPLIAGIILAFDGLPAVHAQEAVEVRIDAIDTSAYPQVRATVTVIDSGGRPIGDLPAGAFSADAEGETVPVIRVESGLDPNVPAAVVLTFDSSGSMEGAAIEQAREAGKIFVGELGPNDQAAVITFSSAVQVVQPFTNNAAALTAAIDGIRAEGHTALFDAVVAAADSAPGGVQRAVVLLSDGEDAGGVSTNDRPKSLARAQSAGVQFFVIGLGDSVDQSYLQELANVSSGQLFVAPSPADLQGLYETIGAALRSQYILELDGAALGAGTPTLRVSVNDAAWSGSAQTAVDLTALATPPPPTVVSTPPASVPVATVVPTPVTTPPHEDGGSSLMPIVLGAAVLAVGGTAGATAAAMWFRRRREAVEEPALRAPNGRGPSGPVFAGNEPVFVGSGPLGAEDSAAWLEVSASDRPDRYPLGEDPITVGFTDDCTIRLPAGGGGHGGARVRLWRREGRYMLHNLSRLGRVTVGGKPVVWAVLEDGDEILLGSYLVVFHDSSEVAEEPAAPH